MNDKEEKKYFLKLLYDKNNNGWKHRLCVYDVGNQKECEVSEEENQNVDIINIINIINNQDTNLLIKAYTTMLKIKTKLDKISKNKDSIGTENLYSEHDRLLDLIVKLLSFHEDYGNNFIYKMLTQTIYTDKPDEIDLDMLFEDDPIYVSNVVIPNSFKSDIKVLSTGKELIGLYAYVISSIGKTFNYEIHLNEQTEQLMQAFKLAYNLPDNIFEEAYEENIEILKIILDKIDKMGYVKDEQYHMVYDMLYRFFNNLINGFTLPLHDLWEYLCLNHYTLEHYGENSSKSILFFDFEDEFYIRKDLNPNTFKLTIENCDHYLRPDLVIDDGKIHIIDFKFKINTTEQDKVRMNIYQVALQNAESEFLLPVPEDKNKFNDFLTEYNENCMIEKLLKDGNYCKNNKIMDCYDKKMNPLLNLNSLYELIIMLEKNWCTFKNNKFYIKHISINKNKIFDMSYPPKTGLDS